MEIPPPNPKMSIETMNDQKKSSLPYPNGLLRSGGFILRFIPHSKSTSLIVSTNECIPSEIMAELLLTLPAANFVTALNTFANKAL
jgi:hypothetical protein